MAIQDNSQNYQSQPPLDIKVEQPQSSGLDTVLGLNDGPLSLHNFGYTAPISRDDGTEAYVKLRDALIEKYKERTSKQIKIAVIDLNKNDQRELRYSSLIVAVTRDVPSSEPKENIVAFHVLLLEKTGMMDKYKDEVINGTAIQILRTPAEAIDTKLVGIAQQKVQKAFPDRPVCFVDGTVVPSDFNVEDKRSVHLLAMNSVMAGYAEVVERQRDFRRLNLANVSKNSTLNVNLNFHSDQVYDIFGNPMRSDVLINVASRMKEQNKTETSVHTGDIERRFVDASGYIDLVWAPVAQQQVNVWQPAAPVMTQKFAPRLIITDIASDRVVTISSVLMAIYSAMTISDNSAWLRVFKPSQTPDNEVDIKDIGALSIDANMMNDPSGFGERISTKQHGFDSNEFYKLIASMVRPDLTISMDCPEYGPQSWYLSVFAGAANGRQDALNAIWNEANELTNGFMTNAFPRGTEMFVDAGNRIHNGYYTDKNGNKRDLRDIDHLAICNLFSNNHKYIQDWSDSFLKTQYPLPLRMHGRRKLISNATNEHAVFTGHSQRVTFSKAFLTALAQGIRNTGQELRVNAPGGNGDLNSQRSEGFFVTSSAIGSGLVNQAPVYGYSNNSYAGYGQQSYNSRW